MAESSSNPRGTADARETPGDHTKQVVVWTDERRMAFLSEVFAVAGVEVIGAGSPEKGKSSAVAQYFDCKPVDDLRQVLTEGPASCVVIGSADAFASSSDPGDVQAVLACHRRGGMVLSLEPVPASALEYSACWSGMSGSVVPADLVQFVPRMGAMRSFRDAADSREMFGPVRTLLIECCTRPEEGSLGAAMYRAVDMMHSVLGEPMGVDAAYSLSTSGLLVALPGESLRELHGDLTAHVRFDSGCAAVLLVSDQSGRWSNTITMLGPGGRFRIYDDGFEWVGMDAQRVDAFRQTQNRGEEPQPSRSVAAVGEAIGRLLDPTIPRIGPVDHAAVLAVCQAMLLSARTGSAERPATIRRMMELSSS